MKKERYYYSTDLSISSLEVLTTNSGEIVGASNEFTELRKVPRITICGIYDNEANTMTFGASRCASRDNFVRATGRNLAKSRAIEHPFKVVSIKKDEKVSDVFIDNAQEIEKEILRMSYPIKFF